MCPEAPPASHTRYGSKQAAEGEGDLLLPGRHENRVVWRGRGDPPHPLAQLGVDLFWPLVVGEVPCVDVLQFHVGTKILKHTGEDRLDPGVLVPPQPQNRTLVPLLLSKQKLVPPPAPLRVEQGRVQLRPNRPVDAPQHRVQQLVVDLRLISVDVLEERPQGLAVRDLAKEPPAHGVGDKGDAEHVACDGGQLGGDDGSVAAGGVEQADPGHIPLVLRRDIHAHQTAHRVPSQKHLGRLDHLLHELLHLPAPKRLTVRDVRRLVRLSKPHEVHRVDGCPHRLCDRLLILFEVGR
mmetsp:Transcript_6312/g.14540  ORF Transcript_6312/g.14540 Transcript_6312/m.14540 type:complete len:294 (-) Transcript_6312:105-986(-)